MHVYTLCRIIDAPGISEQLTNRIHALHRNTNTITMPTYKYDVFLCHFGKMLLFMHRDGVAYS